MDWRKDQAPEDGTTIQVRYIETYRFREYKPTEQKKQGKSGRWQRLNEYGGWENCPPPTNLEWRPHE